MGPLFAGAEDGNADFGLFVVGFLCCVMLSPALLVTSAALFVWALARANRPDTPPPPKE